MRTYKCVFPIFSKVVVSTKSFRILGVTATRIENAVIVKPKRVESIVLRNGIVDRGI